MAMGKRFWNSEATLCIDLQESTLWMEGIANALFIAFSFTIVIEGSLWLFFPSAIPESLSYIGMIWVLTLVAIVCAIYVKLQDATDDSKNNDNLQA
jgi:uncharacterized protein YjeT (DUF2065 family)